MPLELFETCLFTLVAKVDCLSGIQHLFSVTNSWSASFVDHSWIKEHTQLPQVLSGQGREIGFSQDDVGSCSFSTPLISASRDVSFSTSSLIAYHEVDDHSSPVFSCRSSFSSVAVETPLSCTINFSFQNSFESESLRFSTPIQVMPSFAFFTTEQQKPFSFTSDEPENNTFHMGRFPRSVWCLFILSIIFVAWFVSFWCAQIPNPGSTLVYLNQLHVSVKTIENWSTKWLKSEEAFQATPNLASTAEGTTRSVSES